MSRSKIAIGLVVAVAAQVLVLTGVLVKAAMPLWTGTEIRIKTVPVDPRSLLRGNYALLNYEISRLPEGALRNAGSLRYNEVVYVSLVAGEDGLYRFSAASLDKPAEGVFLRGRILHPSPPHAVEYGIEAFFAPREKALQLERDLRNGGVAVLMVDDGGNVALRDVVPYDAPGAETP